MAMKAGDAHARLFDWLKKVEIISIHHFLRSLRQVTTEDSLETASDSALWETTRKFSHTYDPLRVIFHIDKPTREQLDALGALQRFCKARAENGKPLAVGKAMSLLAAKLGVRTLRDTSITPMVNWLLDGTLSDQPEWGFLRLLVAIREESRPERAAISLPEEKVSPSGGAKLREAVERKQWVQMTFSREEFEEFYAHALIFTDGDNSMAQTLADRLWLAA